MSAIPRELFKSNSKKKKKKKQPSPASKARGAIKYKRRPPHGVGGDAPVTLHT